MLKTNRKQDLKLGNTLDLKLYIIYVSAIRERFYQVTKGKKVMEKKQKVIAFYRNQKPLTYHYYTYN